MKKMILTAAIMLGSLMLLQAGDNWFSIGETVSFKSKILDELGDVFNMFFPYYDKSSKKIYVYHIKSVDGRASVYFSKFINDKPSEVDFKDLEISFIPSQEKISLLFPVSSRILLSYIAVVSISFMLIQADVSLYRNKETTSSFFSMLDKSSMSIGSFMSSLLCYLVFLVL